MLAKYKIDPEKFEIIEIDNRKDMDEIQAYMKKVTGFFCQVQEKGDIQVVFNYIRFQVFSMTSNEQISADRSVVSSSCFHRRALHWWRR